MNRLSRLTRLMGTVGLLLLIVFTLARLASFFYFSHGEKLLDVGDALILGLRFDLRIIGILLLLMLIIGNIPYVKPYKSRTAKRTWSIVLAIIFTAMVFMYVVDFAHYSYLNQRLNASVLNYLDDAGISFRMVWQSYPVIWLLIFILGAGVAFYFVIEYISRKIAHRAHKQRRKKRIGEFAVWFVVLALLIFGRISQYPLRWSDAFGLGSDFKANLALNPFESFFNTLKFRNHNYDPKKLAELYPVLNDYYDFNNDSTISYVREVKPADSTTNIPNIVLIICESFSAYKSSSFGNPLNTTPFFDSIANNGLLFTRCFTPSYGTARGVWATITSNPDVESPETASRNPSAVKQKTIINAFHQHDKYYFLGGSTSWANIRGLLQNNIDSLKIYEQDDFDAPQIDVWGISDKNLFLEANKVLAKNTKPFFAVIQTADNHRPYTIPDEDLVEFKKEQRSVAELKAAGFESLAEYNAYRYTDYSYRKFFEAASKESYFGNTIFIFIGDHGIPGNAGDLLPEAYTQQRLTQHHVPMLFYGPGKVKPGKTDRIASQIDLLPTLAGLLNIPYTNASLGRDLRQIHPSKQFAFLFDGDNQQISIIDSSYLYRYQLNSEKADIYSIINNVPVNQTDPVRKRMQESRRLAEAMYEAGKYMLTGSSSR